MKKKGDIFSGLGGDASDVLVMEAGAAFEKENKENSEKEKNGENGENGKGEGVVKEIEAEAQAPISDIEPPTPEEREKLKLEEEQMEAGKQEKKERLLIRQAANRARNIVEALSNVKIFPMSNPEKDSVKVSLLAKPKFKNFFDHVFVSQHAVHHVGEEGFCDIIKTGGSLRLETGKHIYALQEAQLKELASKMGEMVFATKALEVIERSEQALIKTSIRATTKLIHSILLTSLGAVRGSKMLAGWKELRGGELRLR